MTKLLLVIIGLYTVVASADFAPACFSWVKDPNVYCLYNGTENPLWHNQCTGNGYASSICLETDPNQWNSDCSKWKRTHGMVCLSQDGFLEQEWTRQCLKPGYLTQMCADI